MRILSILAGLSLAATAGAPDRVGDASAAIAALQAAGHAEVRDIEFEDGLWEAEVRRADGGWYDVAVDPASGEVFDRFSERPLVALEEVLLAIEAAGYRQVHDLDRDGATWEAEAVDGDGLPVELRVSGYDGRVLVARPDDRD